MAIPSGSGTEVLKRAVFTAQNNTTVTLLTVPTDHIVTILNLLIINRTGTAGYCNISTVPSGGAFTYLMNDANNLPGDTSIAFNEKVVMYPADVLKVASNSTGFDIWLSYIDQDWS